MAEFAQGREHPEATARSAGTAGRTANSREREPARHRGEVMSRIVMLTIDKPLSRAVAHALRGRFGRVECIVEQRKSRIAAVAHRARRVGVKRAAGQLMLLSAYGAVAARVVARRRRAILAQHRLDSSPLPPDIIHKVPSVNADETIRLLQMFAPDVVVVFHAPIISGRVLASISAPFINLHGGITPAYRGNFATYWTLVSRDYENCGATVHLVDKGVDTGDIIYQTKARPTPDDNFFTYQYFQTAQGIPLLLQAVDDALDGSLRTYRRDTERSEFWRTPTLFEYLRNGWRAGVW
jgi:folate-dependent phosphoribosylglycinamide formyltransferase PurN